MKKVFYAILPLAFAVAACDGPRENAGEEIDKEHGEGELMGKGPAEAAGEQLDQAADQEADAIVDNAKETAKELRDGELPAPGEQEAIEEMAEQEAGQ